jgi:hypothetical protein
MKTTLAHLIELQEDRKKQLQHEREGSYDKRSYDARIYEITQFIVALRAREPQERRLIEQAFTVGELNGQQPEEDRAFLSEAHYYQTTFNNQTIK